MKIVIIGGHLTPALSVIEALPVGTQIFYIGRKFAIEGDKAYSLEFETINNKGIPFINIKTGRIQRSFTKHTIPSFSKIPYGFFQAFKILRKCKPDVVVGFGGYVSFPVIVAAKALKIPTVIHEQTLEAGAANKLSAKFADKICISFPSSQQFFPKEKTILTGNPIRKSILNPNKKFELNGNDSIIYITGGSQGSHFINLMVAGCLSALLNKYSVVHQTGASTEFKDFQKLEILKEGLNNNIRNKYLVSKFFSTEEVGAILKASTLVISRSGINSVSEIVLLKKPSMLIPLPVSQKDEQMKNALFVKKYGLGEVIEQKDLSPESFLYNINQMMQNIEKYEVTNTQKIFPQNAAQKIIDVIYDIQKSSN